MFPRLRAIKDPDGSWHFQPSSVVRSRVRLRRAQGPWLCGASAALFLVAAYLAWGAVTFAHSAVTAVGAVTRNQLVTPRSVGTGSVRKPSPMYRPIIEFVTPRGERIEVSARTSSSEPKPIGTKVEVLFAPDAPHDARIDSTVEGYAIPFVLAVLGACAGMLGVIAFVWNPGSRGHLVIDGQVWENDGRTPLATTTVSVGITKT